MKLPSAGASPPAPTAAETAVSAPLDLDLLAALGDPHPSDASAQPRGSRADLAPRADDAGESPHPLAQTDDDHEGPARHSRLNAIFAIVLAVVFLACVVGGLVISLGGRGEAGKPAAPPAEGVEAKRFDDQLLPPPAPRWPATAPAAAKKQVPPSQDADRAQGPPETASSPLPKEEAALPPAPPPLTPREAAPQPGARASPGVRRRLDVSEDASSGAVARSPAPAAPPDTPEAAARLQELVATADNPNKAKATRVEALSQLIPYGPRAAAAIPAASSLVADHNLEVRKVVFELLYRIGPASIPTLRELVANRAAYAPPAPAISAIQVLGAMGPDAREAAPDLVEAARVSDVSFEQAVQALAHIQPDPQVYVAAFLPVLKLADPRKTRDPARFAAHLRKVGFTIHLLGLAGPEARDAVPDLSAILALGPATSIVHQETIRTLGKIGPDAKPAVPVLRTYLDHPALAKDAEQALERIEGR